MHRLLFVCLTTSLLAILGGCSERRSATVIRDVGMRTDQSGAVTFDYGTIATQVVGLVIGVPTETSIGPLPGSSFNADGTITLIIPKSAVGSPAPGDLLGAVNGRTFTGDTPETQNLERSTLLVDHTFVKGQRDNGHPRRRTLW